jgi:ATP-dependent Clp protease ATP-binding subunit ClpA
MFERFTDRARTVVVLAQEQARSLSHNYIGTEHLLLGLLAEGNGVAAKVLEQAGISLEAARADVIRIVGSTIDAPTGSLPFTPRAKTVLEASLRESLRFGHDHIGTEHILLGIVDEGAGLASQILTSHGFSPDDARGAVMREIGLPEHSLAVGNWKPGRGPWRQPARVGQNMTRAVAEIYVRARELAGDQKISSGHMLRALVADSDSQATTALASLGISADRVEGALAATSTEGTTDDTPEAAIARIASIRTEEDRVVIELADRDLARSLEGGVAELTGGLAEAVDQLRTSLEQAARKAQDPGSATMGE